MSKFFEIDGPMHLRYKAGSNQLQFEPGEVTEELVAETPSDTALIPLCYESEVVLSGEDVGKLQLTHWWLVIFIKEDGIVKALVGHSTTPDWIMRINAVEWDNVLSVDRLTRRDIDAGFPFYVSN